MNFFAMPMALMAAALDLAATGSSVAPHQEIELLYVWDQATIEAKVIIVILVIFSIFAWSVMASKALQMRRARKLNMYFNKEFRAQNKVLGIYDRRVQAEGCPLFATYQEGCLELDSRLKLPGGEGRRTHVSIKGMEHVKRTLERV